MSAFPGSIAAAALSGVDCYGLLRLVFRELRGIELPSLVERYQTAADAAAIAALIDGELDPWDEIAAGDEAHSTAC
jgi:cell wall-associated NlpC family hydrolase